MRTMMDDDGWKGEELGLEGAVGVADGNTVRRRNAGPVPHAVGDTCYSLGVTDYVNHP